MNVFNFFIGCVSHEITAVTATDRGQNPPDQIFDLHCGTTC